MFLTWTVCICRCSQWEFCALQSHPQVTPVPYFHLYHACTREHTHTHTIAHSLSPGGCFHSLHRRCSADNRLWQMSRHHLWAVTCSGIETNQNCHRAAWSRQRGVWLFCFINRSVSLLHCLVCRTNLRAVQQSVFQVSVSAWERAFNWLVKVQRASVGAPRVSSKNLSY